MGLLFAAIGFVGLVMLVRSLRVRGCVAFGVWLVLGVVMMWVLLQFTSGLWRV